MHSRRPLTLSPNQRLQRGGPCVCVGRRAVGLDMAAVDRRCLRHRRGQRRRCAPRSWIGVGGPGAAGRSRRRQPGFSPCHMPETTSRSSPRGCPAWPARKRHPTAKPDDAARRLLPEPAGSQVLSQTTNGICSAPALQSSRPPTQGPALAGARIPPASKDRSLGYPNRCDGQRR